MMTLMLLLATAIAPQQNPVSSLEGDWVTAGYGAVVHLEPCAEDAAQLCGDLLWVWDPEDVKQDRIGSSLLEGFEYDGEAFRGGRLKSPVDGKVYRGSIRVRNENMIDLKGCAARILCASQTWRRLESLPHIGGLDDA